MLVQVVDYRLQLNFAVFLIFVTAIIRATFFKMFAHTKMLR